MKCLSLDKKISYLYEENHCWLYAKMLIGCMLLGCMLKDFPTKFKYSIVISTLNVYKTSTKKHALVHS